MRSAAAAALMLGLLPATALAAAAVNPVYETNCAVCHQAGGVGMAGVYPRLETRIGALAALPAGRTAILAVVLNGMAGKVQADNQSIMGVMPGFGQLSDGDIADVLTYVSHLGGGRSKAISPREVAAARKRPALSATDVNALFRDPVLVKAAP